MRQKPLALHVTFGRLPLQWRVVDVGEQTITCEVETDGEPPQTPAAFGDVALLAEADSDRWAKAVERYGLPDNPFRVVGGYEWEPFKWEDNFPEPPNLPDLRTPEALRVLTDWLRADTARWNSYRAAWFKDPGKVLMSFEPEDFSEVSLSPLTVPLDWLRGYAQLAGVLDHVLKSEMTHYMRWTEHIGVPDRAAWVMWEFRADLVAAAVRDALAVLYPVRGELQVRPAVQWTIAAAGWWPPVVLSTCVQRAPTVEARPCRVCRGPILLERRRSGTLVRYCSKKCYWRAAKRRQREKRREDARRHQLEREKVHE